MPKNKSAFVCQSCGWSSPKWSGQCGGCSQWHSMVEEIVIIDKHAPGRSSTQWQKSVVDFSQVETISGSKRRISTGIGELDRVLGESVTDYTRVNSSKKLSTNKSEQNSTQGLVAGGVVLIGGEPGIGKSTLLTQAVVYMLKNSGAKSKTTLASKVVGGKGDGAEDDEAKSIETSKILYVAGEESPSQISLRINRIIKNEHIVNTKKQLKNLHFLTSTDVDDVVSAVADMRPRLLVVDSIQTIKSAELSGAAGSIGQVRECAERLTQAAKAYDVPMFLVGHVTKEGVISGPKVLEHIVDAVLDLSGERASDLRVLRALKNRFGATDEVGVFRVKDYGFESVSNPSQLFLEESQVGVPGSATVCLIEGSRPLLIDVQALVVPSQLPVPRRVGRGVELSRIQVMSAVLQKHLNLPLGTADIFVSVAGGFRVREPAIDLGLAVALASSLKNQAIPEKTVFIGEVGLLGEVRHVGRLDGRIREAKRLGFTKIYSRKSHQSLSQVMRAVGL